MKKIFDDKFWSQFNQEYKLAYDEFLNWFNNDEDAILLRNYIKGNKTPLMLKDIPDAFILGFFIQFFQSKTFPGEIIIQSFFDSDKIFLNKFGLLNYELQTELDFDTKFKRKKH